MEENEMLSVVEILEALKEIEEKLNEIVGEHFKEKKDIKRELNKDQEVLEEKTERLIKQTNLTEEHFENLVQIYLKAKERLNGIDVGSGDVNKSEKDQLKKMIIEKADELQDKKYAIDNETFDKQRFLKRKQKLKEEKADDVDKKNGILDEVKKIRKVSRGKIRKFFKKRKKVKMIEDRYNIKDGEKPIDAMKRRKKELKEELYGESGDKKTPVEGSLYYQLISAKASYEKIWKDNAEIVYRLKHPIIGSMRRPEKRISDIDLSDKTEDELKDMSRELRWKLRNSDYEKIRGKIEANENELTVVENDIKTYPKYLPDIQRARQELLEQIEYGIWSDETKKYLKSCNDNELATVLGGDVEESELRKTARDSASDTVRLSAELNMLQGNSVNINRNFTRGSNVVTNGSHLTSTSRPQNAQEKKKQTSARENEKSDEVDSEKEKYWKLMTKKERKAEVEKFLLGNKKNWFAKFVVKMNIFFAGGAEKFHDVYVKKTKVTTKNPEKCWYEAETEFKNSISRTVATKSVVTEEDRSKAYTSAANKDMEKE